MKKLLIPGLVLALGLAACSSEEVDEEAKKSTKESTEVVTDDATKNETTNEKASEEQSKDNQEAAKENTEQKDKQQPVVDYNEGKKTLAAAEKAAEEKYDDKQKPKEYEAAKFVDSKKIRTNKNPITGETILTLDTKALAPEEKGKNYFMMHKDKKYYLAPNEFDETLMYIEFEPEQISDEEIKKLKIAVQ